MTSAAARAAAAALCAALAAAPPARAQAAAADTGWTGWTLGGHSRHHNDALPLSEGDANDARRLRPRAGRNLAYVDDELRLSRRSGGWSLALLARSSGTLVAGAPALELAAQIAAGGRPAGDRSWQADLRLRSFSGSGIALGHRRSLGGGWHVDGEAQALLLRRWHERAIEGGVRYDAASGQYAANLRSDRRDSDLSFPYQDGYGGQGAGLLLAAGLGWQGARAWAELGLHDGGWLHWRGLPRQQQTLNTDTLGVDGDGFVVYRPLIQGLDSQQGGTRAQPWRGRLAGGLLLPGGQRLGLQLERLPGFGLLPALQWQRAAPGPGALALGAEWRVHERRLGLSAGWRGLALHLGADRLGAGARSRELALRWSVAI